MNIIKVLDHGWVRLVESMGSDLSVVRNARVSYAAEWRGGEEEKDRKLINYLYKNHHTSPFESVVFTFDIKCPIFIARQWHRHRTWSYNEVSARYTELPDEFYIPQAGTIGNQSTDNKQVRVIDFNNPNVVWENYQRRNIESACLAAMTNYKYLLSEGVPRELARMVLPLNTYTHFFGTVNLHNLFHFIKLRDHEHAQWETQQYAKALLELITPIVPVAVQAFKDYK